MFPLSMQSDVLHPKNPRQCGTLSRDLPQTKLTSRKAPARLAAIRCHQTEGRVFPRRVTEVRRHEGHVRGFSKQLQGCWLGLRIWPGKDHKEHQRVAVGLRTMNPTWCFHRHHCNFESLLLWTLPKAACNHTKHSKSPETNGIPLSVSRRLSLTDHG
jgi:hypothetical protein